jgi:hypothetical protein
MGMSNGSIAEKAPVRTLALTFGTNRLYLVGRQDAPLWIRSRGPWQRAINVRWHRLDQIPGHWWMGQCGRHLAILGQGARPALVLEKPGGRWQALIPAGRQSTVLTVPDRARYYARPVKS